MAEALLGDLRMYTARQQLGRVAVPEIVKAHLREVLQLAHEPGKLVGEGQGLVHLAVRAAAHQRRAGLSNAQPK